MAKQVLILKGLPASGKSTYARKLCADNPGQYKIINKDALRNMLDGGKWSGSNEKFVLRMRDELITQALAEGKHVLVDDTNLHPKHEAQIRKVVNAFKADFQQEAQVKIKDFTDVDLITCILRDTGRDNPVGEKVINDMYNQYLKPEPTVYTPPPGKPKAIIVDIDGTIALMNSKRGPYDWDKVGLDDVNESVVKLIHNYCVGAQEDSEQGWPEVIIVSGRDGSCRQQTIDWLRDKGIQYTELYLRTPGDIRKDSIIKKEIFDTYIRDNYDVQFVLDDRDQTVEMWRSLGLTCLQVADGNF